MTQPIGVRCSSPGPTFRKPYASTSCRTLTARPLRHWHVCPVAPTPSRRVTSCGAGCTRKRSPRRHPAALPAAAHQLEAAHPAPRWTLWLGRCVGQVRTGVTPGTMQAPVVVAMMPPPQLPATPVARWRTTCLCRRGALRSSHLTYVDPHAARHAHPPRLRRCTPARALVLARAPAPARAWGAPSAWTSPAPAPIPLSRQRHVAWLQPLLRLSRGRALSRFPWLLVIRRRHTPTRRRGGTRERSRTQVKLTPSRMGW